MCKCVYADASDCITGYVVGMIQSSDDVIVLVTASYHKETGGICIWN